MTSVHLTTPAVPEGEVSAADQAAWLRLVGTDGVGTEATRRLLGAFGLPENIFEASLAALQGVVPERLARLLRTPPDDAMQARIAATLAWSREPGNHFITLADARYPARLLTIADPPAVLYVKGRVDLLDARALAIVGSRNATAQGVSNAEQFARSLSRSGLTIVSGLALGIDAAAHEGALDGPGSTVAVIGTGIDIVYPARNRALAHRIAAAGAIVSEFALGSPPLAHHFPRRNRIIAGLSNGVLVVEAAAQSGSLITARLAGEQGREVFAIPGSIHSPLSKGCHRLIRDGAKLVESAEDVLEELGPRHVRHADLADAATDGDVLLAALGHDPASADALAARTGLDAAALAERLLTLELDGRIARLPGDRWQRLG